MPPAPSFNPDWTEPDHPIVNVTWEDAKTYCEWAGGRLPTEAEWEYAARGGQQGLKYPWGNEVSHEQANYGADKCCSGLAAGRDQWEYTSPVGSFPESEFGLYDMAGNVSEWLADWYDEDYYKNAPIVDPQGPASGELRVLRGGSWVNNPEVLRTSNRFRDQPDLRVSNVGFRCAREVSP